MFSRTNGAGGGSAVAGKTTFAKEFLPSIGIIRFLNADEILDYPYTRQDQANHGLTRSSAALEDAMR